MNQIIFRSLLTESTEVLFFLPVAKNFFSFNISRRYSNLGKFIHTLNVMYYTFLYTHIKRVCLILPLFYFTLILDFVWFDVIVIIWPLYCILNAIIHFKIKDNINQTCDCIFIFFLPHCH